MINNIEDGSFGVKDFIIFKSKQDKPIVHIICICMLKVIFIDNHPFFIFHKTKLYLVNESPMNKYVFQNFNFMRISHCYIHRVFLHMTHTKNFLGCENQREVSDLKNSSVPQY